MSKRVKPIIGWYGGKSKRVDKIHAQFPDSYRSYYEPFIGGGSVGLNVPVLKQRYFSEINPFLMNLYRAVRDEPNEFIKSIKFFIKNDSKLLYNQLLHKHFTDSILEAARFYYIITVSYAEKSSIEGAGYTEKSPRACTKQKESKIRVVSKILQKVNLNCCSYTDISPKKGDLVYCDPPYTVGSKGYILNWGIKEHLRFCEQVKKWSKIGIQVLITYGYDPFILEMYKNFHISVSEYTIHAGARKGKENKINKEIMIRNYDV